MKDILLDIRGLSVSFLNSREASRQPFYAVKNLNLKIYKNSFTSIVGESGSGKSVTALSIAKLIEPHKTSGQIIFKPENSSAVDLLGLTESQLLTIRGKEIAYVFQDPGSSLNPVMTIGEQLREAYEADRKSTRLNSSHLKLSRMPSSA